MSDQSKMEREMDGKEMWGIKKELERKGEKAHSLRLLNVDVDCAISNLALAIALEFILSVSLFLLLSHSTISLSYISHLMEGLSAN